MMTVTHHFSSTPIGGWEDYFILGVMVVMAMLVFVFVGETSKHDPDVHSPKMAWLRGGIYFCFAFVLSWLTGVLSTIVHSPLTTPEQLADPLWLGLTLGSTVSVIWGYVFWWPRGTLTHGRKLYLAPAALFGLVWGASSGLIYMSIFAMAETFEFGRLFTWLLTYFFLAAFSLGFQLTWWDIKVSPPHNIREWNSKKVAFAHTPFLLLSLTWLSIYGNAGIYMLFQAVAIGCSAVAMHFPPFWEKDGPRVSRETAIGTWANPPDE